MTINDLINAQIGFTHPHVSRPFQITSLIEAKLINLSMSEKLSIDDLAEILHSFSEKQIGSKFMIETLSQVFEDQIRDKIKNNSKLDCQSAYKGIVAMDKIGLPKAGYFIEKLGGIIDKNLDYE